MSFLKQLSHILLRGSYVLIEQFGTLDRNKVYVVLSRNRCSEVSLSASRWPIQEQPLIHTLSFEKQAILLSDPKHFSYALFGHIETADFCVPVWRFRVFSLSREDGLLIRCDHCGKVRIFILPQVKEVFCKKILCLV